MGISALCKGLFVGITAAIVMGCGGSPADKMMSYQDEVLSILEANKDDLDKAAEEVGKYIEANKEDMKATMGEVMAMSKELEKDPEKAAKMKAEFDQKRKAMEARMEALEKEAPGIKDHAGIKAAVSGFMQ